MECKCAVAADVVDCVKELIDTLWNVNGVTVKVCKRCGDKN